MEEALVLLKEREVTWRRILVEGGKAVLLQVAAPLALLVETVVLGSVSYDALSLYSLVCSVTNLAGVVFNFLSDGVSAKVSKSVGRGDPGKTKANVFYALSFAGALGLTCAAVLAVLFEPILSAAGMSNAHAREKVKSFYMVKALTVPFVQITVASTGILSGYQRMALAASLNIFRCILSVIGTFLALVTMSGGLFELGMAGLISYAVSSCLGFVMVCASRPPGPAFRDWSVFRASDPSELESPLIEQGSEDNFWSFVKDGSSMLLRSLALQSSFFVAAIVAARLPDPEALAAYGIVVQLWMLTSYLTDGFANVGTMLGGRLYGESWGLVSRLLFQRMTERLLFIGCLVGLLFSVLLLALEDEIISVFTMKSSESKAKVIGQLRKVWSLIAVVQPINSLVFVLDGLIYALQKFDYVRNLMVFAFAVVYSPLLISFQVTGFFDAASGLVFIWLAKSAMNFVRLLGLVRGVASGLQCSG